MNDVDPRDQRTAQALSIFSLSVIALVILAVAAVVIHGAYSAGQTHPNVALYCANDPDLPADIAVIGMRAGNEAGKDTGIFYATRDGAVKILVPWCGGADNSTAYGNGYGSAGPSWRRPREPGPDPTLEPSSKFYRDSPSGRAPLPADQDPADNAANGSPDGPQIGVSLACKKQPDSDLCRADRRAALACSDNSKYYFNLGEADMAQGQTDSARDEFEQAISAGRECGSQYAVLAAKRLAALNLPCEYTSASLARISLDADQNPSGGQVIPLANRKQALKALGYYDGPLDSVYGPNTRAAIQRFERDFGFEETGDLTPLETVYLVCSAAQNANDAKSVNVLGIMYVTGLGVVQNTDTGVTWLKKAASRGEPSALYNLAMLYGTGVILSSYQLCDLPEDDQIADSYLGEAAARGQPAARAYLKKYGKYSSSERWNKIINDELDKARPIAGAAGGAKPQIYLQKVGRGCQVNPNPPQPAAANADTVTTQGTRR